MARRVELKSPSRIFWDRLLQVAEPWHDDVVRWTTAAGPVMTVEGWTHQNLVKKLREFERELRAAGLKESTVRTNVDRSETFVKWLVGHYTPCGPNF